MSMAAGTSGSFMILPTLPGMPGRTVPHPPSAPGSTSTFNLGENEKRWLVVGICLNKLLLPTLRPFIYDNLQSHYNHHKTTYNIHNQKFPHHLVKDSGVGFEFNYISIKDNFTKYKNKKKAYSYDVTSCEEFGKLYLQPHMAKFSGFDDTCDLSAALGILSAATVFSNAVQKNAKDIRQDVRNEWGHCNFAKWDKLKFQSCFQLMERMLRSLLLPADDEKKLVDELNDWETKGMQLCMGNLVDADLLKLVSNEVATLSNDLEGVAQANNEENSRIRNELAKVQQAIQEFDKQIEEQNRRISALSGTCEELADNVDSLGAEQERVKDDVSKVIDNQDKLTNRVGTVEDKQDQLETRFENLHLASGAGPRLVNIFQAPNRIPCFCGRAEELEFLERPLEKREVPCAFSVISGLGGTGKTSLALEHVWRNKENYSGGVYWISGESTRLFQLTLTEMARQIATYAEDIKQTLSNTLDWLQTRKEYWCLVIDNLDELELSEDMMKLLNGQWKRNARGHVIVTTRREKKLIPDDIQDVEDGHCLELKSLTEPDSVSFMKLKTNRNQTDEEREIVELVQELGCLPLALDQAGAYIQQRKCTFSEYRKEYDKKKLKLLKSKARFITSYSEARRSVETTWQLNFDYVAQLSEEMDLGRGVLLVMNVSAFLSPDDIPHEIINEGLPQVTEERFRECASSSLGVSDIITLLTNFSLFQRFTDDSYSVHRIVQEVIRSKINADDMIDILANAIRMLNYAFSKARTPMEVCKNFEGESVFIEENPPSLQLWGKLSSHACVLQEHLLTFESTNPSSNTILYTLEAARLLNEASVFLSVCREKVKAQELQRQKLEVLVHLSDPPSNEMLEYLKYFEIPLKIVDYKMISHCMVSVENKQGTVLEPTEGNTLQEKADALREKGNNAFKEKNYLNAIEYYTECISVISTDHRLFANRALCHLKMSQPSKALEDCETCLKLQRNYGKALLRKAWALYELCKQSPTDRHLKGRSLAAAALASYIDPTGVKCSPFPQMFPKLVWFEVTSRCNWLMNVPQMTLLLHDGLYEVEYLDLCEDLQIVGVGPQVSLKVINKFVISGANCCFENITITKGSTAMLCTHLGALTLQACHISSGEVGCEDSLDCNGGTGCIADSPCNRTHHYGEHISIPHGLPGKAGVQINMGSTAFIKDCDIHDCGGGGVLCDGKGSFTYVISCLVHNNRQAGLEAREGASVVSKDCSIFANNFNGVLIGPRAASCEVSECRIFENTQEGILAIESQLIIRIQRNRIYHNGSFGISLQGSNVNIINNEIFENGFWAVLAKSTTTANIQGNEIYSNKCGGIYIGVNFSGRVVIESNTVRDHNGPWLLAPPSLSEHEYLLLLGFDKLDFDKLLHGRSDLPPGETSLYTAPPILRNNTMNNNEERMFHPKQQTMQIARKCAFCHQQGNLKRCGKCNIAQYCNRSCQVSHWQKHKLLCNSMSSRYSVTLTPIPYTDVYGGITGPRAFGSHLEGIGEGPKPNPRSSKRFIVKAQTQALNSHPRQLLTIYDKSLTIDCLIESPEIFHVIMECGVLGELVKFTSKKVFLWTAFADDGKKLTFHLEELAPYQKW